MKRKQFKQKIKGSVKSIVIMPTYGNKSYFERVKYGLPLEIDRYVDKDGDLENIDTFTRRVQKKRDAIATKIKKVEHSTADLWLKSKKFKDNLVSHNYFQDSKVNKPFISNKKRKTDGIYKV